MKPATASAFVVIVLFMLWQLAGYLLPRALNTTVRVESGQSPISALRQAQLIRPSLLSSIVAKRTTVAVGVYTITGWYSDRALIRYLADPAHREVTVTFPEGWRLEQMALRLEAQGVVGAAEFIDAATMREAYAPLLPAGISLKPGTTLEGFLFPDSYRFLPHTPAEEVVRRLLRQFATVTQSTGVAYEQLILASIVEREAKTDDERPLIAGIFMNRLKAGIRLEADPTVAYGRDSSRNVSRPENEWEFWDPVTPADLRLDHRFNTYSRNKLPPTPISSPGRESLEAARLPAQHQLFYFFHDRAGTFQASKTLAEHQSKLKVH